MTATFNLTVLSPGAYGVRVTIPAEAMSTLPSSFNVLPAGQANWNKLIMPPTLGRQTTATSYVEYANTGVAAMAAPILTLQSADPDNSDRPLLTLDGFKIGRGVLVGC